MIYDFYTSYHVRVIIIISPFLIVDFFHMLDFHMFFHIFPFGTIWNLGQVMEPMKPQLRLVDFELPEATGPRSPVESEGLGWALEIRDNQHPMDSFFCNKKCHFLRIRRMPRKWRMGKIKTVDQRYQETLWPWG